MGHKGGDFLVSGVFRAGRLRVVHQHGPCQVRGGPHGEGPRPQRQFSRACPACLACVIAKAETYASRKARFQAEIAGLKQALDILESETALVQASRKRSSFRGTLKA